MDVESSSTPESERHAALHGMSARAPHPLRPDLAGPDAAVDGVAVAAWGRRETHLERTDRNLLELVQEVRIVQTGVQVLFAFLLTLPFTTRFAGVTAFQRDLYFAALLLAGLSALLLIAPSSLHRLVFRRGDKEYVLRVANHCAIAGLAAVAATMTSAVVLVTDVLYGWPMTLVTGLVTAGGLLWFWFGLALLRRRRLPPCP